MIQLHGVIHTLPKRIRHFILIFILVLNLGFTAGFSFIGFTESHTTSGMVENYLGNEELDDVQVLRFKKSEREILTLMHNHILSLSMIFFVLGGLLALTSLNRKVKYFLMFEPFFSILLTFGGIFLLWKGYLWLKYIILLSGILMVIVFYVGSILLVLQLYKKAKIPN